MDEQVLLLYKYCSISLASSWPTAKFLVTKFRSFVIFFKKIIPLHVLSLKKKLVEMWKLGSNGFTCPHGFDASQKTCPHRVTFAWVPGS